MNQDEPEISEQMKTMLSWRIPESQYRFWRDIWHLFLIFLGIAIGIGLFSLGQWWACTARWPEKTYMECMRFDLEPIKKAKK